MSSEIIGGGPHDGALVDVPKNCIAIVTVADMGDGEYVASLAMRGPVVGDRLADCLLQLLEQRGRNAKW